MDTTKWMVIVVAGVILAGGEGARGQQLPETGDGPEVTPPDDKTTKVKTTEVKIDPKATCLTVSMSYGDNFSQAVKGESGTDADVETLAKELKTELESQFESYAVAQIRTPKKYMGHHQHKMTSNYFRELAGDLEVRDTLHIVLGGSVAAVDGQSEDPKKNPLSFARHEAYCDKDLANRMIFVAHQSDKAALKQTLVDAVKKAVGSTEEEFEALVNRRVDQRRGSCTKCGPQKKDYQMKMGTEKICMSVTAFYNKEFIKAVTVPDEGAEEVLTSLQAEEVLKSAFTYAEGIIKQLHEDFSITVNYVAYEARTNKKDKVMDRPFAKYFSDQNRYESLSSEMHREPESSNLNILFGGKSKIQRPEGDDKMNPKKIAMALSRTNRRSYCDNTKDIAFISYQDDAANFGDSLAFELLYSIGVVHSWNFAGDRKVVPKRDSQRCTDQTGESYKLEAGMTWGACEKEHFDRFFDRLKKKPHCTRCPSTPDV